MKVVQVHHTNEASFIFNHRPIIATLPRNSNTFFFQNAHFFDISRFIRRDTPACNRAPYASYKSLPEWKNKVNWTNLIRKSFFTLTWVYRTCEVYNIVRKEEYPVLAGFYFRSAAALRDFNPLFRRNLTGLIKWQFSNVPNIIFHTCD